MSRQTLPISPDLYEYILSRSLRESPLARALRDETARLPESKMQIAPDQGQFMALLLKLMDARSVLEIGTFTGYSAMVMAEALPPDGRLVTCDISHTYTEVARRHWHKANIGTRIDLRIGTALETLDILIRQGHAGSFDASFIDADKEQYDAYYEHTLTLIRQGGLIMIDNVLRGGDAANAETRSQATQAIQALNLKLRTDERVDLSLVPIGDGLTLARKR